MPKYLKCFIVVSQGDNLNQDVISLDQVIRNVSKYSKHFLIEQIV